MCLSSISFVRDSEREREREGEGEGEGADRHAAPPGDHTTSCARAADRFFYGAPGRSTFKIFKIGIFFIIIIIYIKYPFLCIDLPHYRKFSEIVRFGQKSEYPEYGYKKHMRMGKPLY